MAHSVPSKFICYRQAINSFHCLLSLQQQTIFQATMCLTYSARWHNLITILLPYSWLITCLCYEQQLLFLLAALALADLLPHRMPLKWPIGRCARAVDQCQEVVHQGSGNDTAQQVILSLCQDTKVNTFTKNNIRFLFSNQVSDWNPL